MAEVKQLLDAGVSPDAGIERAALGGHVDIVELLLDNGANVNAESKGGYRPLHAGALQGGTRTVKLLLTRGADPNAADERGETSLHSAIKGDCELETVRLLVAWGAKLDVPNNEGVTPVRLAAIRAAKPVYDWLVATSGGKEPPPRFDEQRPLSAIQNNELLTALSSDKLENRLPAQRELVARGKEIMPDVLKRLDSGESAARLCGLFAAMGPAAEAVLPKLESLLADKQQVFIAALTIEQMKPESFANLPVESRERAAAALYEAIVDPEFRELVRYHLDLLSRAGDVAIPYILKLLCSDDPRTRLLGLRTLTPAHSAKQEVVADVLTLLREDEDSSTRLAAADALITLRQARDEVKTALLSIIKQPPPFNPSVADELQIKEMNEWRRYAERAGGILGKFGPSLHFLRNRR
ncbi:MAG: ankyrin repeat domain-containing protein [Pirellulales bacterium]|nr:ankyrin repeat domain-containing protein [Pirellulales bacterium]